MIKFLKSIFKRKTKYPEPGEIWFIPEESPWPSEIVKVTIVDIKDGWVLYKYSNYTNSQRIGLFMQIYKHFDYA